MSERGEENEEEEEGEEERLSQMIRDYIEFESSKNKSSLVVVDNDQRYISLQVWNF